MSVTHKPIICLDFDGVVHSYKSGWQGAQIIPDPIVDGAIGFMLTMLQQGWRVCIFSSRSHHPGGIAAMRQYLYYQAGSTWHESCDGPGLESVEFPDHKPSAVVSIDDRALTFTGVWPSFEVIKNFKPWNKQTNQADPGLDKFRKDVEAYYSQKPV